MPREWDLPDCNAVVLGQVLPLGVKRNTSIWWQMKMQVREKRRPDTGNLLPFWRDPTVCRMHARWLFLKPDRLHCSPRFPSYSDMVEKMPACLLPGWARPCLSLRTAAQSEPRAAAVRNSSAPGWEGPTRFPGWAHHVCFTWLSWGLREMESSASCASWFVFLHSG